MDKEGAQTPYGGPLCNLRKRSKAVSPAISTVILTGAVVILLLVTVTFANNFLSGRMAENEFSAMEQFMQTVGLQIDDVAWTIGRAQTIRYATKYGYVSFQSVALTYTIYVNKGASWTPLLTNQTIPGTGVILFNMPVSKYSMGNNYFKRVIPSSGNSFLQTGTSASVTHVFTIEKLPMIDGNYIRIVVAPSIRMLNSTIKIGGETKSYFKFYLPYLTPGTHPYRSQSITITGTNVTRLTESGVNAVMINVTFPNANLGFDSTFFNFANTTVIYPMPEGSVVEVYIGEVRVSLGLHA